MADTDPNHPGPAGADPAAQPAPVRAQAAAPAALGTRLSRVLVVDDESTIRLTVQKFLCRSGYEVEAFERGADLLRSLGRQPADLIITDVFMPDTDGMQLLMELRKHTHRPKVIVMSGGNNYWASSLDTARKLGAAATLSKPFSLEELLRAVRSALAEQPAAAS